MKATAIALSLAASLSICAPAMAQNFSGSVETDFGFYLSDAGLESRPQALFGGVDGKIGEADAPSAQYKGNIDVKYYPDSREPTVELGETWIKLFEGPFDISLGNQIVAWSISDVFYPSDVVNPWDLRVPVDRERMPLPLGRVVLNGSSFSIDLIAQPYWIAGKMPGSRWLSPDQAALGALPHNAGLDETPDFSWGNVAFGGHAKASLGLLQGLDVGLTYYRGRSSSPTNVDFTYSGYYPTSYHYIYDRITLLGVDLTLAPMGSLLVKTEWGYTTLDDANLLSPKAGEASVEGVSGFEYTIGSAQLEGEYVLDWKKGAAEDTASHGLVGVLSWEIGSRMSLKVAGAYDFSGDGSGTVSPQVKYRLADGLEASLEAYFFFGARATTYGAFADNNLGRLSLKYFF